MGFDAFLSKPIADAALSMLVGGKKIITTPTEIKKDFEELRKMLGDDEEALQHVLSVFVQNVRADVAFLQAFLQAEDFVSAQARCHKMLPMLMQINPEHPVVPLLQKMDRAQRTPHISWQADIQTICKEVEKLATEIEQKY